MVFARELSGIEAGWVELGQSHPSRKDKDAARVGHPRWRRNGLGKGMGGAPVMAAERAGKRHGWAGRQFPVVG